MRPAGDRTIPRNQRLIGVIALLGSIALLLGACDEGMTPPPCQCPNLEEAFDSIDWAPGLEVVEEGSAEGPDGLEVGASWSVPLGGQPPLDRLVDALLATGFSIQQNPTGVITATLDSLKVTAWMAPPSGELPADFHARVAYDGEDSPSIAEHLEPLREALEQP